MVSYKDDLYKLLLAQVMDAPTLSVSAKKNHVDPIDIRVDMVHPTPADVFPAATVAVQAMIDQILLRNNTTDDGSQNSGGGPRRPLQPARVCSYTDFMKCQPLNFMGTEGVVDLSQWVKKMESVFHISGCAVENQEILKKKLTDKYCPKGEIKKLEIELWNLKKLCTYTERQAENKRKLDNNHQAQQQLLMKQNVANRMEDLNLCAPNATITMT
nr:hypothetical protein [Tanacetum cinerariifolium]